MAKENFEGSKAKALLDKAVTEEASRSFFNPVEGEKYILQPDTKKVKIGDKTYERLVFVALSTGVEHLVDPRGLVQINFTDDLQVIQGSQTIAECMKIIGEHDAITFNFGEDCLLLGKKVDENYVAKDDEKIFVANSGNRFIMRAGKIRTVAGASVE